MKYAIAGSMFAVMAAIFVGDRVVNLFAIKLGAEEFYLGVLNFCFWIPWMFRMVTMSAIERIGKRKVLLAAGTCCVIAGLGFLPLPLLAGKIGADMLLLVLLFVFLRIMFLGMANTAWFPILHDIVPGPVTGRFFANLRTTWQTAAMLTFFAVAWFVGEDTPWWKFEVLFILAAVSYSIRTASFAMLSEKPPAPEKQHKGSFFSRFRDAWDNLRLRKLIIYAMLFFFAYMIAEPFKIKYMKDLGFSDGLVIAATAMISLGAIISLKTWGRLADRYGNRAAFSVSSAGLAVVAFLWIFVGEESYYYVFALYLVGSMFLSGHSLAQTRRQMHTVPENKQNQITIMNVLTSFPQALGPFIAGLFLKFTAGIRIETPLLTIGHYELLFMISSALFVLLFCLRSMVRDHGETSTRQVALSLGRPILDVFGSWEVFTGRKRGNPSQRPENNLKKEVD